MERDLKKNIQLLHANGTDEETFSSAATQLISTVNMRPPPACLRKCMHACMPPQVPLHACILHECMQNRASSAA